MEVRDAVEADADVLASLADAPSDVMRNLIHDRTVRVADEDGATAGGIDGDGDADEPEDSDDPSLLGFVSFDARRDVVHVTQIAGTADACEQLLAEPIRFAHRENMAVQLTVPEVADDVRGAAERAGFDERGSGPRFDGAPTVRYRLDP